MFFLLHWIHFLFDTAVPVSSLHVKACGNSPLEIVMFADFLYTPAIQLLVFGAVVFFLRS